MKTNWLANVLGSIGEATAVANTRTFSGRLTEDAAGDQKSGLLEGEPFVAERSYFSVRIVEMRLAEAGRYGVDFVPMCSCFLKYTYGDSLRSVPFVIGSEMITSGLEKSEDKTAAQNITFSNIYAARNIPVKADGVVMYAALCRFANTGFAKGLLNLVADAASAIAGPVGAVAIETGADLTGRLAALLGADGVDTKFGTLTGNILDRSGYRIFAGVSKEMLNTRSLIMRDGQLYVKRDDGTETTIDDIDYMVLALEKRDTIVDENFGQVSILPFHRTWISTRESLLKGDRDAANLLLSKLLVEVASSPDVTESDRVGLITAYRSAFDQWVAIQAGGKTSKLASQPGTLEARLQELATKGGGASRSLQAARISVSEGRQPAAIQLIKEKKENEFLAKRAQSVTRAIVQADEDVTNIQRASQLLLSSALH